MQKVVNSNCWLLSVWERAGSAESDVLNALIRPENSCMLPTPQGAGHQKFAPKTEHSSQPGREYGTKRVGNTAFR